MEVQGLFCDQTSAPRNLQKVTSAPCERGAVFWPMDTLSALLRKMDEYSEKARKYGFDALVGPFQEYNERQRKKYDRLYIRTLKYFIKESHGKKNP